MSALENLYAQMWEQSIDKFIHNECEIDPLINNETDMRRGITVLSYFDDSVGSKIDCFLHELKMLEPEQYYYPRNELHLTILSIISCISGFKLSNINIEAYALVFIETVKQFKSFKIHFKGITVSSSCILIQGFPDNKQLNQLRDALRINFTKANLESTIDSRYKLITAHTTAVRCLKPFKNNEVVMNVLLKYKDYDFGTLEVSTLALVFNNWYQNLSMTKRLSFAKLKSSRDDA
jgi:2'-5' RNA ligase